MAAVLKRPAAAPKRVRKRALSKRPAAAESSPVGVALSKAKLKLLTQRAAALRTTSLMALIIAPSTMPSSLKSTGVGLSAKEAKKMKAAETRGQSYGHRRPVGASLLDTPSLCERLTVTENTEEVYRKQLMLFNQWMMSEHLEAVTGTDVLVAALEFIDVIFMEGEDRYRLAHFIAGLNKFIPSVKDNPALLKRVVDAGGGRKKRVPAEEALLCGEKRCHVERNAVCA